MPPRATPETQAPLPVPLKDSPTTDKPAKKKTSPVLPPRLEPPKDTVLFTPLPKDSVRVDSVVSQPALPDVDLYRAPPPLPQHKKPKGVKGITDDDYKISAKKDSGQKQ